MKRYMKPTIDMVDLKMEGDIMAGSGNGNNNGNVLNQNNNDTRDNLELKGDLSQDVFEAAKHHNAWETWD